MPVTHSSSLELLEAPGAGEQRQCYENSDPAAPIYFYFQKQQLREQLSP